VAKHRVVEDSSNEEGSKEAAHDESNAHEESEANFSECDCFHHP
jgi:hypothetical protein